MKPNRQPKRMTPRVLRWTAHVEAKARAAAEAAELKKRPAPYDDGFRGELPEGAIRADRRKQRSVSWSPVPRYYYRYREFDCQSCGMTEVWTARQQQWWYEVAQGELQTTATTCRSCRKRKQQASREAARNTWLAKFARLKKLTPKLAGIPWDFGSASFSTLQRPLASLALEARCIEALRELGIHTPGALLDHSFSAPVPGITLHDLDALGRRLKALLPVATKLSK